MQLLSSFLKLLVALALQASHTQQWDRFSRNSTSEGQVLPFQEVWGRSFCRPLEMLVDIVSEYPSEVEHMFSPSCIALQRCTGCCGDETLQCVPVETANVTMQLLKMKPVGQVPYVELSFTEHRQCACRPRRDTLKSGRRRPKGRGKRKREKQRPKGCDLIAEPKLIGAASLGGRRSEAETACSGFLCSYTEQGNLVLPPPPLQSNPSLSCQLVEGTTQS